MTNKSDRTSKVQEITNYTLLLDNVLVKGVKIEKVGGIINPDTYEDKPEIGEVIAVGKFKWYKFWLNNELKVGDTILFNKYSTTKFNLDGTDYFIIRLEDCIGYQR